MLDKRTGDAVARAIPNIDIRVYSPIQISNSQDTPIAPHGLCVLVIASQRLARMRTMSGKQSARSPSLRAQRSNPLHNPDILPRHCERSEAIQ
jgi:hypothetical protein